MEVGAYFEEPLLFDYREMLVFLDLVKDDNPSHRLSKEDIDNPDKLKDMTVQGMYAASMFSGLLCKYFPETINVSRELNFVRPVLISDKYVISLKVRSIDYSDATAVLKGYIRNSSGKVCIDCITKIKNIKLFSQI